MLAEEATGINGGLGVRALGSWIWFQMQERLREASPQGFGGCGLQK